MAGDYYTRVIQEAFPELTWFEAETLKQEIDIFAGSSSVGTQDSRHAKSLEALRKSIDRFIADLRRRLDEYATQPGGAPANRIVLTGGSASMKGLTRYIESRLGLPVGEFEMSSSLDIACDLPAPISVFSECLGAALTGLGCAPITVTFPKP